MGQKVSKVDLAALKKKKAARAKANGKANGAHVDDAPKKMKQQTLPGDGMAPTVHKSVNEAAEALGDAKERCASSTKHKKSREEDLIREMRKVGLTHYVNRGLNIEIIVESPDRVKLKKYNHEDAEAYP